MDRYHIAKKNSTRYARVDGDTNKRFTSVSSDPDWDEIGDELGQRPTQFALCACMYALFGMKTTAQALFDTRVQLKKLITLKQQQFNGAEFRYNRARDELKFYKKTKDINGAMAALASRKTAEQRMENTRRAMLNFEAKLTALEDVNDSKESTEALKAIGKNMKHLNLSKRMNDVQKAYEAIDENKFDMEELQTILKPPPMTGSAAQNEITEEELKKEVLAFFQEEDQEDEELGPEREMPKISTYDDLRVPQRMPKMKRQAEPLFQ